jgi:septum formation protein
MTSGQPSGTITSDRPLVLGSQSPRRSEILRGLGLPLLVRPADADESRAPGEPAEDYVARVARLKLEAVAGRLASEAAFEFAAVLVADTTVVVDGDILGKPEGRAGAVRMLERITGRAHRVLTHYALSLSASPGVVALARTVESEVHMRAADTEEICRYADTGEGLDKAGAYAVQGIGAFLVERIVGSYTNVVGLPACELVTDLKKLGLLEAFPGGELGAR